MGATLCIGKSLHLAPASGGSGHLELVGTPCDGTNIAYSSVAHLEELAHRELGISPESWPFYHNIEMEWQLPVDEIRAKCEALRELFRHFDDSALPDDYWLREFARLLREGWDFCTYV